MAVGAYKPNGGTMNRLLLRLIIVSAVMVLSTDDLAAQCRTAADTANLLVSRIKLAYASMDTVFVKSQGDPVAAPSAISLVTKSNTCKSAVSAYNNTHGLTSANGIQSAYVIALGKNGYVVINPAQTSGEYTMMFVYNSSWVFKRAVAG
jgi:hypothetical protein